jgi:hypothetical protein
VTKEWAGKPDPAALTRLRRFHFIAQVTDRGELSEPFALEGIRVEDVAELPAAGSGVPLGGAVAQTEAAEVTRHLETLDERILAELTKRRRKSAKAKGSAPETPASADSGEKEAATEQPRLWVPGGTRPKQ